MIKYLGELDDDDRAILEQVSVKVCERSCHESENNSREFTVRCEFSSLLPSGKLH